MPLLVFLSQSGGVLWHDKEAYASSRSPELCRLELHALGSSNHARLVHGWGVRLDTTPALQVGSRLGAWLTTLPCYKLFVTEPSRGKPNCHYLGGLKHQDASMINLGESRGEARVRKGKTTPKNNMEENGGDKECRYWLGESYTTSPR